MFDWIRRGLQTGIVTTRYPGNSEPQPEGIRNLLVFGAPSMRRADAERVVAACPTGAISITDSQLQLDLGRCIQCGRCVQAASDPSVRFTRDYEVATRSPDALITLVPLL